MAAPSARSGRRYQAAALAAVVAAALLIAARTPERPPFRIGAIVPLTGSAAFLADLRDGMLMAADEVNRKGGIGGRMLEVVVEDSRSDPGQARACFERLESSSRPELYVSSMSPISIALAPLAAERRVVLVGLVVTAPEFSRLNDWTYRYYATSREEADATLEIVRRLNVTNVGVLYTDEAYGRSVLSLLQEGLVADGRQALPEPFNASEADLGPHIDRVRMADAVYVVGVASSIRSAFAQLKGAGYRGAVIGASGASYYAASGDDVVAGTYFTAPPIYNPRFPFATDLRQRYEARSNRTFNHYVAVGYDLVRMLDGLLEKREPTRDGVKRALEGGFVYPGALGQVELAEGGHDITFPLFPARAEGRGIVYLR